MNRRITYTPPRLSPDLPLALESRILAGSVVDKFNAGGVTTAAQSYEEKDFSNSSSFSHEWE